MTRAQAWRQRAAPWALPVLLLLVWQWASVSGWLSTRVLPEPLAVLKAFWRLGAYGELATHVAVSSGRAASGFAIGAGLGLLLGLLTGSWRLAETLLDTSLQMVRNIPALALIPLVILWFGIDESAKLFLVALGVFFPVYLNTFHGIRAVDKGLIEMAGSYGLRGWRLYRHVILPGALPSILVGVRFSLGLMWVLLIVAETLSAQAGIGYLTMNAREFLQTDVVLVGIVLYALLGKLADLIAKGLERRWLRWHPGYQRSASATPAQRPASSRPPRRETFQPLVTIRSSALFLPSSRPLPARFPPPPSSPSFGLSMSARTPSPPLAWRTLAQAEQALPAAVRHLRAQLDNPAADADPGGAHRTATAAPAGLTVQAQGLGKAYGARTVLQQVDLTVRAGEFVALVGRSGCGKTTLLRLVAGLEAASSGDLRLDGQPLAGPREDVRIMFQDARLLPWKRVIDNVALGLDGPRAQAQAREALDQVGLADRADEWPAVLSGGQRQRVALARALVHRPRLLLLDEPLGALDALTRLEMHELIDALWRTHGFTALLVTHDVGEAVALADRVVLLEQQRIALDQPVSLPHPRHRGDPALAALESAVLQRVLQTHGSAPGTASVFR